jgi:hypothetical protein
MAFARAREHRHEFMTVEHLLLALLSNPSAREALEACSVDLVALRQELEAFIEQTTPVLPASEEERDTQPTLSFQRVLQRAVFHVQSSGRNEVTGANVLVAIFSEQESQAAYLLRKHEVSRLDVVNFISIKCASDDCRIISGYHGACFHHKNECFRHISPQSVIIAVAELVTLITPLPIRNFSRQVTPIVYLTAPLYVALLVRLSRVFSE